MGLDGYTQEWEEIEPGMYRAKIMNKEGEEVSLAEYYEKFKKTPEAQQAQTSVEFLMALAPFLKTDEERQKAVVEVLGNEIS